jgi:hypothetical protein
LKIDISLLDFIGDPFHGMLECEKNKLNLTDVLFICIWQSFGGNLVTE